MNLSRSRSFRFSAMKLNFLLLLSFLMSRASADTKRSSSEEGKSKNILFFPGLTFYSHRLSVWPLVIELANQGHNITFMSCHPPKTSQIDPRIHEFVPLPMIEACKEYSGINLLKIRLTQGLPGVAAAVWDDFSTLNLNMIQFLSKDPGFMQWLEESTFDLVVLDPAGDFGMGMAYKFGAQIVFYSTTSPYPWQTETFGGHVESWIPDLQYAWPEQMNYVQRMWNILRPIHWEIKRKWFYFPQAEKTYKESMGLTGMVSWEEMEKNASLILVNTHYSEDYARSLPPKVISVGGLHCFQLGNTNENGVVSKELKTFMDNSNDTGFIYVSFGSAAQMSKLPNRIQQLFMTAMRRANTKFVLKWDEDEVPDDFPQNVLPVKWMPQQSVLAHPNIRAFISHGGLLGTQESVCAGVPMIFIPMFGEQDFNANRHVARGTGIKLDWQTLTQEALYEAISKILQDPSYKTNMARMSTLFLDRPQTPLKTAVWWINYILRHGLVDELQSRGIHQTWIERRELDVWLPLTLSFLALLFILFKIAAFVFKIVTVVPPSQKQLGKKRR